jgi:hypothetical protein
VSNVRWLSTEATPRSKRGEQRKKVKVHRSTRFALLLCLQTRPAAETLPSAARRRRPGSCIFLRIGFCLQPPLKLFLAGDALSWLGTLNEKVEALVVAVLQWMPKDPPDIRMRCGL